MKTNHTNVSLCLSRQDTDALKGIALILLLIHHLFYIQNGQYDDIYIYGHGVVEIIGKVSKVCVAIFVFLSGYGLMAGAENVSHISLKEFYTKRFTKLYSNYWLIWLLFVPIGVIAMGLTFPLVYGEHWGGKFILDLFGLLNCIGLLGYNPTWWFYSCIILLYLIFPIIVSLCEKEKRWIEHGLLFVAIILCWCPLEPLQPIRFYLFSFILGIYCRNGLIGRYLPPPKDKSLIINIIQGNLGRFGKVVLLMLIPICFIIRMKTPFSFAIMFDSIITILIVLAYKNIKTLHNNTLRLFGRHSFNIFLFHTFLFYLYFPQIIYFNRNPLAIFATLLVSCLLISLVIEYIKKAIGFNNITKLIMQKHD